MQIYDVKIANCVKTLASSDKLYDLLPSADRAVNGMHACQCDTCSAHFSTTVSTHLADVGAHNGGGRNANFMNLQIYVQGKCHFDTWQAGYRFVSRVGHYIIKEFLFSLN